MDIDASALALDGIRTLPDVEEERIHHAFGFMVGTMLSLVAEPGRVESLSSGRYVSHFGQNTPSGMPESNRTSGFEKS
jgi:hypothetical protein